MTSRLDIVRRQSFGLLWVGIGAYALFFSALTLFDYRNFAYGDWDLATYNQVFRGLLAGQPYMSLGDLPYLGLHAEVTMLLFLPVYALIPHPATLLVLQSVVLALAALPLFLIARTVFSEVPSLLICVLYFFYPAVARVNLNEFHPECLLPFIQFFLFYYFLRRDFRKFFIFMLLCIFAKENMPLIVAMFGAMSIIQKREMRWILWPIIASLSWFIFYRKILFPHLSQGRIEFMYMYGDSLFRIACFTIKHPLKIFFWLMRPRCLVYLFYIFLPLGFTSFFAPGVLLLALPNFFQHLLSSRLTETNPFFYYPAEFLAFVFISSIFGMRRIWNLLSAGMKMLFRRSAAWVIFALVLASPQAHLFVGALAGFKTDEVRTRSYQTLIRAVPPNAAVVATFSFLPELSRRFIQLDSFHKVLAGENYPGRPFVLSPETSWALIDFEDEKVINDFLIMEKQRENFVRFFIEGNWNAQMVLGNTVLLRKNMSGQSLLSVTFFQEPARSDPLFIFDERLVLLGVEKERVVIDGQEGVGLRFSWKLLAPTRTSYGFKLLLVDQRQKVYLSVERSLGYHIYPTPQWDVGALVTERFQFLLPRGMGVGPYQIWVIPINWETGTVSRATGGREVRSDNKWLRLVL